MIFLIFLLFLPLIEIALFAHVGGEIGALNTILLCIAAGVAGMLLVQYQGLKTTLSIQQSLDRGEMPVAEMFDGICKFMAGILLILPGFFTDTVALLLLVPFLRGWLRHYLARYFTGEPIISTRGHAKGDILEGEFTRVDNEDIKEDQHRLH
ncbi:MAG: FxsA family protein [Micavibrio sp.]